MRPGILIVLALLQGAPAFAQDKKWSMTPQLDGKAQEAADEMKALFKKVEARLTEIDQLLYDAGAGDTKLAAVKESGIAELLDRYKTHSQEVQSGIDRIIEIAEQSGGGT